MREILLEIQKERERQINKEGWSQEHDDKHADGSIADAAACYASEKRLFEETGIPTFRFRDLWPWHPSWFKKSKHDRKRQLVIAGALIVAELERLGRLEAVDENRR